MESARRETPNGQDPFFVNPDKNLAQTRKDILSKKLAMHLQPLVEGDVKAAKISGAILIDGKRRIASLVIKDEFSFDIVWDPVQAGLCRLDTSQVTIAFRNEVGLQF